MYFTKMLDYKNLALYNNMLSSSQLCKYIIVTDSLYVYDSTRGVLHSQVQGLTDPKSQNDDELKIGL